MQSWSAYRPVRLSIGQDIGQTLEGALSRLGAPSTVLVASSGGFARALGYLDHIEAIVARRARVLLFDRVAADPSVADAEEFAAFVAAHAPGAVIAFGGGSVIDTVKVGCALAGENTPVEPRLRHGRGAIPRRGVKIIAIPTTAGTGSEVTPYAVLRGADTRHIFAVSERLFPDEAVIWPQVYSTVPRAVISDVASDALTHALEALWSRKASPYSDSKALDALARIHRWVRPYHDDPADAEAGAQMAAAACLAGFAFATAFTTVCHGLSFPVAEHFGLSHGRACATLIAAVAEANLALRRPEIDRMVQALGLPSAFALPDYLLQLRADLGDRDTLGSLARAPVVPETLKEILAHAHRPMIDNNGVRLSAAALKDILTRAW